MQTIGNNFILLYFSSLRVCVCVCSKYKQIVKIVFKTKWTELRNKIETKKSALTHTRSYWIFMANNGKNISEHKTRNEQKKIMKEKNFILSTCSPVGFSKSLFRCCCCCCVLQLNGLCIQIDLCRDFRLPRESSSCSYFALALTPCSLSLSLSFFCLLCKILSFYPLARSPSLGPDQLELRIISNSNYISIRMSVNME